MQEGMLGLTVSGRVEIPEEVFCFVVVLFLLTMRGFFKKEDDQEGKVAGLRRWLRW